MTADDYPIGETPEALDTLIEVVATGWGTPDFFRLANPSLADDPDVLRAHSKMARSSATPRSAAAQYDYILRNQDVRHALPLILAPTLVLQVSENPRTSIERGRYLAENIAGRALRRMSGRRPSLGSANHWVIDEIAEFLTGERPVVEVERILTTILFSDIVGSTAQAASLGDQRWRSLLDAHDKTVRNNSGGLVGRDQYDR